MLSYGQITNDRFKSERKVRGLKQMIDVKNVRKSFGGKEVLKGLNISVKKGEIFGLLGPSGAGKTTLINILTGQLSYDGEVKILGGKPEDIKGEKATRIGIMMDSFGIYERFSCYDNLKLFADIYNLPKNRIDETLEAVGLGDDKKTKAAKLSKGMRSRLRLARVFMGNPEIIFLDEPTSGLDPQTAESIRALIKAKSEQGCTIFLTTHDMNEAYSLCDHTALLNEGKIVEYGTPKEICRRYNHRNKIALHLYDGSDLLLENNPDAGIKICELQKAGSIETIHSTEPNLETVFLELTGRKFTA